ncbi:MAG: HAD family phosphatase [Oscillospiraceae bacterium]|nr:HAD family phosphatase [Oscillospiraceae bacterium]MBR7075037.1 HAD family phosphatase [Oscillospiraceae bacterium]
MIKNIVFDMGNVIIRFDRDAFIDRFGVSEEERRILLREIFLSPEWVMMDRGTLTDEQAADILCPRVPEHLQDIARKLIGFWDRPILEVEGIEPLIEELKGKGYGIYLLSNASCRQPDYWQRVPAARFFDGTLISYSVKLIKPMPEIYEKFFEKFSLKREECFFIDDSPANIEASLYVGMPGAVFHNDIRRLRRDLRAAGVDVEA